MALELSIVILSFNQYDLTTGPCLASLSEVDTVDMEIIVVDNGSEDDTLHQLAQAASRDPRVKLVLNSENRGYAGGNNDGVAQAQAEFIVLLNSDTRVLPTSMPLLVRQLKKTTGPAMIGPVTNAAGNEQQIFFESDNVESVLEQGALWCRHAQGSMINTDQLSFFCVAMPRTTYTDLGGLDEGYSLGFYEDTDFCCRAVRSGVKLQIMEEAFVYHAGSASFSTMPETVKKLLKENRKKFRERNGKVVEKHVRYKNLDVLQSYLGELQARGNNPALAYRFKNRLNRARELTPNSPVKKMLYSFRLKKILHHAVKESDCLSESRSS